MSISLAFDFKTKLGFNTDTWIDASSTPIPEEASRIAKSKPKCLAIACQGMFAGNAEESPGLDLVLWLRLKHEYEGPILLVGFLSEEDVRKGPKNSTARFLINAPSNRYVQLPVPIERLPELKKWLETSSIKKADIDREYRPYLQAGFNVENFRHSLANKFGLKCAWDLQNLIREKDDPYPEKLRTAVESDKNLLIAGALHPLPKDDLSRALSERQAEKQAQIDQLIESIEALQHRLKEDRNDRDETLMQAHELLAGAELLRNGMGDPERLGQDRALIAEHAANREDAAEELRQQALQADEEIELDDMYLPSLEDDLAAAAVELEAVVPKLRNEVLKEYQPPQISRTLKVLHVDDELDLGWSELIKRMIDPQEGEPGGYRPLQPLSKSIKDIKREVLAAIEHKDGEPDVILLDLRLMGEDERLTRLDSPPSGVQVLGAIRHSYKTIPVIVTTASNKLWSLRMVMDRGADAYWIKQGVELNWGTREAVESYVELQEAMAMTRHPLVVALRKMERLYAWMGEAGQKWWETGQWANGDRRVGKTSDARRLLGMAVQELHDYLRQHVFTPRKTVTPEWGISSICNRLGGVAERIIAPELNFYSTAVNGLNRSRNNHFLEVMRVRGDASHGKAPAKINWHVAAGQVHALYAWLRSEGRNESGTP